MVSIHVTSKGKSGISDWIKDEGSNEAEEIKSTGTEVYSRIIEDTTMTDQMIQITLPKRLVDRLSELISETEFDSVDQYVAYVLEELVNESMSDEAPAEVSEGEEEEIKKRLIALGYFE